MRFNNLRLKYGISTDSIREYNFIMMEAQEVSNVYR